ncbi:ABC transporter permease [Actinoplanes subtropicus]|uniref:ABC transporter permease n=1 Tax=Actinoplanes subtropicus TaxID=543632 RepID=UPI000A6B6FD5|nr:ABC transporter permease subunit [Actinoplanes subtropicus]
MDGSAGVVLGILLGRARFAAEVAAPFIKAANAVPRIVLASLFIIWFGLGLTSKVATAVVLVFFAVFFNAFQGAREVDRNLVDNARILGASRTQVLTSIVVPSATSWIFASLHAAFGFALIGAVVGEYAGADKGLGLLIANAQGTFDAAGIYAGMIIITVVALLAKYLLTLLEKPAPPVAPARSVLFGRQPCVNSWRFLRSLPVLSPDAVAPAPTPPPPPPTGRSRSWSAASTR